MKPPGARIPGLAPKERATPPGSTSARSLFALTRAARAVCTQSRAKKTESSLHEKKKGGEKHEGSLFFRPKKPPEKNESRQTSFDRRAQPPKGTFRRGTQKCRDCKLCRELVASRRAQSHERGRFRVQNKQQKRSRKPLLFC